jgi:hypothetical protein
VFSGHVPNITFHPDVPWEQVPPSSRWGTEYVAVPVDGHATDLVILSESGDTLRLDCGESIAVLPGQVLRLQLVQATRVSSSRPFLAMLEVRRTECDAWEGVSGATALTPQALYRTSMSFEPLNVVQDWLFATTATGMEIATLASVVTADTVVSTDPPLEVVEQITLGDAMVQLWNVADPTSASGAPFRGMSYGVSPHPLAGDGGTDMAVDQTCWSDITYVTTLGYDCLGCVAQLSEPVTCP